MQLIIAGFHRSGTSLLTQLLHSAGLFVGDELLGALPTNPYGHFEDVEVLRLHRAIMERHGADWQWDAAFPFFIGPEHWNKMRGLVRRRDLAHASWGFKDPRVCLFLGAWKYVMPDVKVVIVYRDPGDCVRSMESRQARDHFEGKGDSDAHLRFFREPDHGLRLWDTYNRALLAFARAHPADCLVIPFSRLTEGYPVVDLINERFGAGLDSASVESVFDGSVTTARTAPQRVHDPQVGFRVSRTWESLEQLARKADPAWSR